MLTTMISFAIMYTVYMSGVLTHIIFDMDASLNKRISCHGQIFIPHRMPESAYRHLCSYKKSPAENYDSSRVISWDLGRNILITLYLLICKHSGPRILIDNTQSVD